MAGVIRRRYLGGAAAALGGLLAAACGEIEVRYVQGPAGASRAQQAWAVATAGAAGATGADRYRPGLPGRRKWSCRRRSSLSIRSSRRSS